MMRHLILLCTAIMLFVLVPNLKAQNINPANVDVSALSEGQIQQLISEMQKRGMTEQQALALARSRGMNDSQISLLKERILAIESNQSISRNLDSGIGLDKGASDTLLSDELNNYLKSRSFLPTQEEESMFGFQLFNNQNLTFQSGGNYAVTDDYQIDVGDEFRIDVYGASQQSYVVIVNKNGQVTIPNIGPIAVGGRSFAQSKQIIREKLGLIYRDLTEATPKTFLNIHLGSIPSITVHVMGEVFLPGTFTLPGSATAFNALHLSGGPNIKGTFREIQVIRNGKIVHTLDVYDYLINGNGKVNVSLADGDVIMVPTYRNRVRVGGEFIRNGVFESKEGETVQTIIEYAGGFNENAFRERVEIYRNTGREREVKDVLTPHFADTYLQNGDSVFVGKTLDRFTNRVFIAGAVFRPGTYELSEGLTLGELISKADGIREDAFTERATIMRLNKDLSLSNISFNVKNVVEGGSDILLQREDSVHIVSIDETREKRVVHIYGEVQFANEFDYREKMTLGDLILLAGGFKEAASESYIEVTRRLPYEEALEVRAEVSKLFQFDIPRNLSLKNKDASFELLPFDEVYVRRAPGAKREGKVRINGEVRYSGEYALVKKNERVSDLIERSGGVTDGAFLLGAMLTRRVSLTAKEKRLREFALSKSEGLEIDEIDFEIVGVDLKKAIKNPGGRDDVYLRDGDELVIPRHTQTIKVGGGVLNPLSMPYIQGKGARYYVRNSGGFALRAKRSRTYVVYANGSAGATSSFLFFKSYPKIMPGSEIIVPQKPEQVSLPVTAWIAIGSGISTIGLTLVTLINAL